MRNDCVDTIEGLKRIQGLGCFRDSTDAEQPRAEEAQEQNQVQMYTQGSSQQLVVDGKLTRIDYSSRASSLLTQN